MGPFGVELATIADQDGCVPKLVVGLTEFILTNGTNVEGIFRLSCAQSELERASKLLAADHNDLDFLNDSSDRTSAVHLATALYKKFLRELPTPLITECVRDDVFALATRVRKSRTPEDIRALASELGAALRRIPPAHLACLRSLLGFVDSLAKCAEKTKMNERNLAIVLAPNVVRPPKEIVDPVAQLHILRGSVDVITFLFEHARGDV